MAQSAVFPIFLRAEYKNDGAGFKSFQSDAARAAAQAKREFQGVSAALDQALSRCASCRVSASFAATCETSARSRSSSAFPALKSSASIKLASVAGALGFAPIMLRLPP